MIALPAAIELLAGARRQAHAQWDAQPAGGMAWLTPGLLWPDPQVILDAIDRWLFREAGGARPVEEVRNEWPSHRVMPEGLRE